MDGKVIPRRRMFIREERRVTSLSLEMIEKILDCVRTKMFIILQNEMKEVKQLVKLLHREVNLLTHRLSSQKPLQIDQKVDDRADIGPMFLRKWMSGQVKKQKKANSTSEVMYDRQSLM